MKEVKIFAHRGASGYAPENTLAAFRLAEEQGSDGNWMYSLQKTGKWLSSTMRKLTGPAPEPDLSETIHWKS